MFKCSSEIYVARPRVRQNVFKCCLFPLSDVEGFFGGGGNIIALWMCVTVLKTHLRLKKEQHLPTVDVGCTRAGSTFGVNILQFSHKSK